MFADSLTLALVYLLFGLLVSYLLRKDWAEDWDENLLASVLGPPLFLLIAVVVVGRFVWLRLGQALRPAAGA
jgi:hypothetical protein